VERQSEPPTGASPATNIRKFDCIAFTNQHGIIPNKY